MRGDKKRNNGSDEKYYDEANYNKSEDPHERSKHLMNN